MNYWLVKSEPEEYSYKDLEAAQETIWDGIRNYQARNYLREMKIGDQVLYYHSGKEKSIVGLAEVSEEAFPDKKDTDGKGWVAVRIKAKAVLKNPLSLEKIKEDPMLSELPLLKQPRLSVMPVAKDAFDLIIKTCS